MKHINFNTEGADGQQQIQNLLDRTVKNLGKELDDIPDSLRIHYNINIRIWREEDDDNIR